MEAERSVGRQTQGHSMVSHARPLNSGQPSGLAHGALGIGEGWRQRKRARRGTGWHGDTNKVLHGHWGPQLRLKEPTCFDSSFVSTHHVCLLVGVPLRPFLLGPV